MKSLMAIALTLVCHNIDDLNEYNRRRDAEVQTNGLDVKYKGASHVWFKIKMIETGRCQSLDATRKVNIIDTFGPVVWIAFFDEYSKRTDSDEFGIQWTGYGTASEFGTELPAYPVPAPSQRVLERRKRYEELQKTRGLR